MMATKKVKPATLVVQFASSPAPALNTSSITKVGHLAAMHPLTARNDNEGRETVLWAYSTKQETLAGTFYPFFLHSIFAGLDHPTLLQVVPRCP